MKHPSVPLARVARKVPFATLMAAMHPGEIVVADNLVRVLLAEQFPDWADLPLQRVEMFGTDNAVFRLGTDLAVRLARRDGPAAPGGKEMEWLPRFHAALPMEIPLPVAQGVPSDDYPWYWDVQTWVHGDVTTVEDIDPIQAARDLAAFVAALQRVDPAGAPSGRGIPLADRDPQTRR